MAGLLPSLPTLGNPSAGYSSASTPTAAQSVLGNTLGGALDRLNNAITPQSLQSSQTTTWNAIGEFFALISDVQRMATIAAGIVFLLAGLRLLGGTTIKDVTTRMEEHRRSL